MELVNRIFLLIFDLLQVVMVINAIWSCEFDLVKKKVIGYLAIVLTMLVVTTCFYNEILYENTSLILCIVFSYMCIKSRVRMRWLGILLIYAFISFVDTLAYMMVYEIEILHFGNLIMFGTLFGSIFVLGISQLYLKLLSKKLDEGANRGIVLLVGCILILGFLIASYSIFEGELELQNDRFSVAVAVFVLLVTIGCIWLVYISIVNEEYKIQEAVSKEKEQLLNNYYINILNNNMEIRRFYHDYKNHMRNIRYFLKEQKYEELGRYIDEMDGMSYFGAKTIDVGHDFVSAILSDYMTKARNQGIEMNVSDLVPDVAEIADIDWSIILSNCLNNAMEAVAMIENGNKQIQVRFSQLENKMVIEISNSIARIPSIIDGDMQTTKEDKFSHGLGIRNVRASIKKYRGSIKYVVDEKEMMLTARLMMHMKKNSIT